MKSVYTTTFLTLTLVGLVYSPAWARETTEVSSGSLVGAVFSASGDNTRITFRRADLFTTPPSIMTARQDYVCDGACTVTAATIDERNKHYFLSVVDSNNTHHLFMFDYAVEEAALAHCDIPEGVSFTCLGYEDFTDTLWGCVSTKDAKTLVTIHPSECTWETSHALPDALATDRVAMVVDKFHNIAFFAPWKETTEEQIIFKADLESGDFQQVTTLPGTSLATRLFIDAYDKVLYIGIANQAGEGGIQWKLSHIQYDHASSVSDALVLAAEPIFVDWYYQGVLTTNGQDHTVSSLTDLHEMNSYHAELCDAELGTPCTLAHLCLDPLPTGTLSHVSCKGEIGGYHIDLCGLRKKPSDVPGYYYDSSLFFEYFVNAFDYVFNPVQESGEPLGCPEDTKTPFLQYVRGIDPPECISMGNLTSESEFTQIDFGVSVMFHGGDATHSCAHERTTELQFICAPDLEEPKLEVKEPDICEYIALLRTNNKGICDSVNVECKFDCHGHGECNHKTGVCACDAGYLGAHCYRNTELDLDTRFPVLVDPDDWVYFNFAVEDGGYSEISIFIEREENTPSEFYIQQTDPPTELSWTDVEASQDKSVVWTYPRPSVGTWYIGVHNPSATVQSKAHLTVTVNLCPNNCSEHGSCVWNGNYHTCECDPDYTGDSCNIHIEPFPVNMGFTATLTLENTHDWMIWRIMVEENQHDLQIFMNRVGSEGDPDLYLRKGAPPTQGEWDAHDVTTSDLHSIRVPADVEAEKVDPLLPGIWYVGVHAWRGPTDFVLKVDLFKCYSNCNGHGTCGDQAPLCICDDEWEGHECNKYMQEVEIETDVIAHIPQQHGWQYFHMHVQDAQTHGGTEIMFTATRSDEAASHPLLFIRQNEAPTMEKYDYKSREQEGESQDASTQVVMCSTMITAGRWDIGVHNDGNEPLNFKLRVHFSGFCPGDCLGHGTCLASGQCECTAEWEGPACGCPKTVPSPTPSPTPSPSQGSKPSQSPTPSPSSSQASKPLPTPSACPERKSCDEGVPAWGVVLVAIGMFAVGVMTASIYFLWRQSTSRMRGSGSGDVIPGYNQLQAM